MNGVGEPKMLTWALHLWFVHQKLTKDAKWPRG